jgi:transcriptional regulator with XRE-family HTH domain
MENPSDNDAETLKNLRETAGLDVAQLAAMANLSPGQVRQLEGGGDSNFYSAQIKAQSMRRVLRLLQNQPKPEEVAALAAQEPSPKSGNVIDDIIRMSEKNLKHTIDTSLVRRSGNPYKALLLVGVVLVLVVVLMNWQSNPGNSPQILSEWVNPFSTNVVSDAPTPVLEQPVNKQSSPLPALTSTQTVTEVVTPTALTKPAPVVSPPPPPVKQDSLPTPVEVAALPSDCKLLTAEPVLASPVSVNKPGSYVYLVSAKDTQICVEDGKHVSTVVNLKAGEGKSIHGLPPWVIGSAQIAGVQVFFQGAKVLIPKEAGTRILLKEQAVSGRLNNLPQ